MRLPDKTCWEMLAIANSSKRVKLNVMSISSNTLSIFARWKHVLTQVLDGDVVMMFLIRSSNHPTNHLF